MKFCFGKKSTAPTILSLDLPLTDVSTRPTNFVKTARYSGLNFFFKCGLEQFRNVSNVYFLIIIILSFLGTATNLFDSPYPATGTLLGLVIVVGFTMGFEGYYDIKRHREDAEVNNRMSMRLRPGDGLIEEVPWSTLKPGDLIKVNDRSQFPADLIFVAGCSLGNKCYVETANIDGETNLKIKHVPKKLISRCMFPDQAASLHASFQYDLPNSFLQFSGTAHLYPNEKYGYEEEDSPLDFSNLLLRGCVLRNTPWILGVVVYAGPETKAVQSSREAATKMSRVQKLVNRIIFLILVVLVILCVLSALAEILSKPSNTTLYYLRQDSENTFILPTFIANVFTFIVLYSSLLPISLLFCMTFSNFFQALFINWDLEMYHEETDTSAKCNTMELVQELGQVSYLFSDKTGTLTRNEMKLVGCAVGKQIFGIGGKNKSVVSSNNTIEEIFADLVAFLKDPSIPEQRKESARDFLLINSVCHTVLVDTTTGDVKYNAEGPDEEALVEAAAQVGYQLISTDNDIHTVQVDIGLLDPDKEVSLSYEVLAMNQFNSTRKRMSCVCKAPDGTLWLFAKGADSMMFERMDTEATDSTTLETLGADLEDFANDGLRTLVMGKRKLSQEEFKQWKMKFDDASNALGDRKQHLLDQAAEEIEHSLCIVGASAIEDRLQDGVPETLVALREAGVKTWVLTGDKVETAINIAFSAKLLTPEMELVKIVDDSLEENLETLKRLYQLLVPKNLTKDSEKRKHGREVSKVEQKESLVSSFISFLPLKATKNEDQISDSVKNNTQESKPRSSSSGLSRILDILRPVAASHEGPLPPVNEVNFAGDETNMDGIVAQNLALVISGTALQGLLQDEQGNKEYEDLLLSIAKMCSVVVACRVSPKQKALIVKMAKNGIKVNGSSPITLAIGDGANDVAMIQEARVGVGISGHEGRQAVNSADFSIAQFRYLQALMLVHGRWNYRRAASMVLFVFYANIVFVLTAFIFNFYNKFSGSTMYFVFLTTMYSYPTQIPIAVSACINQDISRKTALEYPAMYVSGRENLNLDRSKGVEYILKSFLHAFLISAITIIWAAPEAINIAQMGTATYVACIFVCVGRSVLETYTWTYLNMIATAFGFLFVLIFEPIYYSTTPSIYIQFGTTILWNYRDGSGDYVWMCTFLAVIICYVFDIVTVYIRREFFPSLVDVVIEIDRGFGKVGKKKSAMKRANKLFRKIAQPLTIPSAAISELVASAGIKNVGHSRNRSAFAYAAPEDEHCSVAPPYVSIPVNEHVDIHAVLPVHSVEIELSDIIGRHDSIESDEETISSDS